LNIDAKLPGSLLQRITFQYLFHLPLPIFRLHGHRLDTSAVSRRSGDGYV
jgi:hypothetical protein